MQFAQTRGKFQVDAVEAAIGEDGNDVAGNELRREIGDDRVSVGVELGGRSRLVEGADDFFRMQALGFGNALLLVDAGEHDAIGETEARDELGRENLAAQRVGARFKTAQMRPEG